MQAIAHFWRPDGRKVGVLENLSQVNRPIAFNGLATAKLAVSKTDPQITTAMLDWGNIVCIESDSGVEPTGWIIRGGMQWNAANLLIPLASWEALLDDRPTEDIVALDGVAPGDMVRVLFDQAKALGEMPISIQDIEPAGSTVARDFRAMSIYDAIEALRQDTGFEWEIGTHWPVRSKPPVGLLRVGLQLGRKQTGIVLREKVNVSVNTFELNDDNAVTEVVAFGGDGVWGQRTKVVVQNEAARGWARRKTVVRTEAGDSKYLSEIAGQEMEGVRTVIDCVAVNVNDEWARIRNGDTVTVDLLSFGPAAAKYRARVMGRQVDELNGQQRLALEVAN